MAQIPNFVISMPTSDARRDSITRQFNAQNIPFSFFDALPVPPNPLFHAEVGRLAPNFINSKYSYLTPGEISCAMGHFLLWEKCVKEGYPYIGIFEDDAILSSQAHLFLTDDKWLVERSSQNKNLSAQQQFRDDVIIRLETTFLDVKLSWLKVANLNKFRFARPWTTCYGTAGYIISNAGARKLLEIIKNSKNQDPVDMFLFVRYLKREDFIQVVQLRPAVIIQEDVINPGQELKSALQEERAPRQEWIGPPMHWDFVKKHKKYLRKYYSLERNLQHYETKKLRKGKSLFYKRKSTFVPFAK